MTQEIRLKKARDFYNKGLNQEAIKTLETLLLDNKADKKDRIEAYLLGGSALRKENELTRAINALKKGLEEFPNQPGILHNLGNCYRDQGGSNRWKALDYYKKVLSTNDGNETIVLAAVRILLDLSFPGLAYEILRQFLNNQPTTKVPSAETFTILLELAGRVLESDTGNPIATWCVQSLGELVDENHNSQAGMAVYKARLGQTEEAINWFKKAQDSLIKKHQEPLKAGNAANELLKGEQNLINSGWNLGCYLLKKGNMSAGWKYYNYGLQAPAAGLQRWQRALPKPFNTKQVPVWNGEDLGGKHLLIMGEQAIGDTMMFLRILPLIIKETNRITLSLPERLVEVYKRTYSELEVVNENIAGEVLQPSEFDYQIPCGSIPNLRLKEWFDNGWEQTQLVPDMEQARLLKLKYRENLDQNSKLIGISWLGGGKSERLRSKSIPPEQFGDIMKNIPDARFVSLQYGKCVSQIEEWKHQGIDIIHDKEVNPLKDMDLWISQVAACDAIISVANTTIHGSGGLEKPTLCLQSRSTDWRWIDQLDCSYWYASVDAISQKKDGSWESVKEQITPWLNQIDLTISNSPHKVDERRVKCMNSMTFN